jgi:predicted nucleic acid-binding protein
MTIFLDTSTIVKLYFAGSDSPQLRARLRLDRGSQVGAVFLSALTPVEFASAAEKAIFKREGLPVQ